jgi:acetoin utilization deacetylase AcuC-like enzyme
MQIFYSDDYFYHKGFKTSLENSDRISQITCLSKEVSIAKDSDNKLLQAIETKFKNTKRCCQTCTYICDESQTNCSMCESSVGDICLISDIKGDTTYMCTNTYKTLNSLINCIYYVLDWQMVSKKNAFILSRPPGHHSDNTTQGIMGFCLINNISFGVDYYLEKNKKQKVVILDWDVHHGNGTQKIYYTRNDVLFIDIHRENFYPKGTGEVSENGEGDGLGYTINIPLRKGSDDNAYNKVFDNVVIPRIKKYNPDWIFISCGFDAHIDDPLGGMKLTDNSYKVFHEKLLVLNIPLTYFLEGGYNPSVVYNCVKLMTDG